LNMGRVGCHEMLVTNYETSSVKSQNNAGLIGERLKSTVVVKMKP